MSLRITITRQVGDHTLSATTDPENHVTHREVLRELDRAGAFVSQMIAARVAVDKASTMLLTLRSLLADAESGGKDPAYVQARRTDIANTENHLAAMRAALETTGGEES